MSDDGQTLMILHSNGQSYVELGKEGTVDIYSTNSFNVRTQGDINFHADRNINIHAKENLNIQAKNIQTNSEENTKLRSGKDFNIAATGKITGLAGGAIAWGAAGDASLVGGGQTYVNGSKVNLNSGKPGTTPASINPIPLVAQTDTLFDQEKGFVAAPGKLLTIVSRAPAHAPWANAGQGVDIKTSMNASDNLPANASPATNSVNQTAQNNNPSPPAIATVASAPTTTSPVSKSLDKNVTAATVAATATNAAKGPLNKAVKSGTAIVNTNNGVCLAVGPMALTPAQMELGGLLKPGASTMVTAMIQNGANISQAMPPAIFAVTNTIEKFTQNISEQAQTLVNTMKKSQSALGQMGAITGKESPTQLAGIVMSAATVGVGPTVAAIQQSVPTITIDQKNLSTLPSNITLDTTPSSKYSSMAGIKNSLVGTLSGTLNGAVSSIASGIQNTAVNTISQTIDTATNNLLNTTAAINMIGMGGMAAKLTETIGGLGGIQSALTAMGKVPSLSTLVNQTEGIAVSAFNAVKDSFKPLQANVPQNLTKIAKDSLAGTAAIAGANVSQTATNLLDLTGTALGAVNNTLNVADSALTRLTSLAGSSSVVNQVDVNNSVASITGETTVVAAYVSNLSNAGTAITSTINNLTGVVTTVGSKVTGSPLNTVTNGPETAMNIVNAFAGAAPTLQAGGGTPMLSNAAVAVRQGAQGSSSSILAAGLSNLPGGINTVTNVVNRATGALNMLPGTESITQSIQAASSSVINGLNTASTAVSTLTSLSAVPGQILSAATDKLNGLTSLVTNGLSVGKIAELQSAISSLTGGTPGSISLPAVGFNTTDRGAITTQISNNLGDPGIPTPNLVGEIPQQTKDSLEDLITKNKERLAAASEKLNALLAVAKSKKDNYIKQRDLQGENDPSTQQFYKEWKDLINSPEFAAAEKEYIAAFDANRAARDAKLNQDLAAINNATDANSLLALARRGKI